MQILWAAFKLLLARFRSLALKQATAKLNKIRHRLEIAWPVDSSDEWPLGAVCRYKYPIDNDEQLRA